MKTVLIFVSLFLSSGFVKSQNPDLHKSTKGNKKGSFYLYWGWNHDRYTKSNIHFTGEDYDFTLKNVKAIEHQSPLKRDPYLKINSITIPQYNFRVGYFINNHLNISIGADHMKYVMLQNQKVHIEGNINHSNTQYDGTYDGTQEIALTEDFLKFEHTDGLNYLNIEVSRFLPVKKISKKAELNFEFGLGTGLLYPRSDVTLLSKPRHDKFHVAGYGFSSSTALNFTFYRYFFLQAELKAGFINMPNIRTTMYTIDKAKQHFGFMQGIVVFGFNMPVFYQTNH